MHKGQHHKTAQQHAPRGSTPKIVQSKSVTGKAPVTRMTIKRSVARTAPTHSQKRHNTTVGLTISSPAQPPSPPQLSATPTHSAHTLITPTPHSMLKSQRGKAQNVLQTKKRSLHTLRRPAFRSKSPFTSFQSSQTESPCHQSANSFATTPSPGPTDQYGSATNITEGGMTLTRSRTNLVEVINGRSKRWLFDPKNKKKLHPQWMWHDDEETFDTMLASGRGRFQSAYHDIINTARSFMYSVLLPAGYPDSVHNCYTQFSTWQFVETSFNQFIHVLCSQAMLSCVGLPTDTASAAGGAVAIKWIAKDGIAHFSKLFFTKSFAYQLDFRPKTWGLVSELFFIFGSAFELSTAILAKYNSPEWFLPLAALGASLQSVAHLAWEATHATFNKYLSLRNNLADVTAKADSQMVMSELLGMSIGLFYINYFNEPSHLWGAFLCVLPLHLGSTVMRLKAIKFGKLSSSRLLQHYNSYVQHRLGPTRLQPGVTPVDILGATAEHIPPEIYTNKAKALEYIKAKIDKAALYNTELQAAREQAAQTAAATAATTAAQAQSELALSPPPILRPAAMTKPSVTPLPTTTNKLPQAPQSQNINQKLTSLNPSAAIPQTLTHAQLKKIIDPYQELQAVQSIMAFATPEQFHHTDRKLGEWFDAKAWVEIYGYPEIKMCAPIDEAFENEDELFGAVSLFRDRGYLVNYRPSTNKIYLSFEEECEHDDLLQSLLVATRLAYDIRKNGPPSVSNIEDKSSKWIAQGLIRDSLQWSLRYEDQITALLAEGDWDVDELTWPDTGTRVYWEIKEPLKETKANPPGGALGEKEIPHASLQDGNVPPPINVANIVSHE